MHEWWKGGVLLSYINIIPFYQKKIEIPNVLIFIFKIFIFLVIENSMNLNLIDNSVRTKKTHIWSSLMIRRFYKRYKIFRCCCSIIHVFPYSSKIILISLSALYIYILHIFLSINIMILKRTFKCETSTSCSATGQLAVTVCTSKFLHLKKILLFD